MLFTIYADGNGGKLVNVYWYRILDDIMEYRWKKDGKRSEILEKRINYL